MSNVEKEFRIINRLGLHARAAGHFRRTAAAFNCDIEVVKDHITANAKSLLGLMALEAAQGTTIKVVARGEDAEEAVAALEALVSGRFGESE